MNVNRRSSKLSKITADAASALLDGFIARETIVIDPDTGEYYSPSATGDEVHMGVDRPDCINLLTYSPDPDKWR